MNTENFPVLDSTDFKGVVIDAMEYQDGVYLAMFSFFTRFGEEVAQTPAEGLCWVTQLEGESLVELYTKIDVMVDLGLFNGIRVSAEGTLYDAEGLEIGPIDWNSFADAEDDITDDIIAARTHTLH